MCVAPAQPHESSGLSGADAVHRARRFASTKRFRAAVTAINSIDASKFPKLLVRILKELPAEVCAVPPIN
jgi:hypothetical protein